MNITGIRPGEKVHEILVSDEEAWRTYDRGDYYAIKPMLPELVKKGEVGKPALSKEYCSGDDLLSFKETKMLLEKFNLMIGQTFEMEGEFLK